MLFIFEIKVYFYILQGPTGPIGPPGPAGQPGDKVTLDTIQKRKMSFVVIAVWIQGNINYFSLF